MKKLIAIAMLTFATGRLPGAKMCIVSAASSASSATTSDYDENGNPASGGAYGAWANGTGCGDAYDKTGAISGFCSGPMMGGVAKCGGRVNPNLNTIESAYSDVLCFCRRTYPVASAYWAQLGIPGTGAPGQCNNSCANHCAKYLTVWRLMR